MNEQPIAQNNEPFKQNNVPEADNIKEVPVDLSPDNVAKKNLQETLLFSDSPFTKVGNKIVANPSLSVAAGNNNEIQFNLGGQFGASPGLTFNSTDTVGQGIGSFIGGVPTAEPLKLFSITADDISFKTTGQFAISGNSSEVAVLETDLLSTQREFKFPNASGTIALTSDIPGSITGTDKRILFFDGANSPAGNAGLTFDKSSYTLGLGIEGNSSNFKTPNAISSDTSGVSLNINTGDGVGTGGGGTLNINSGEAGDTGDGGSLSIGAGQGGATSGAGGTLELTAGSAQGGDSNGGDIILTSGTNTGAGVNGKVSIITSRVFGDSSNPYLRLSDSIGTQLAYGDTSILLGGAVMNILINGGGAGKLNIQTLPTSSAGLSTGDVWNDSGTLKIV